MMKLHLRIQDPLLKESLDSLLAQAGFFMTDSDTDCDGVLYTPPYAHQTAPSLNFFTLPHPLRLLDLLSLLTHLPYAQCILFSHFSLDLRKKILNNFISQHTQRLTEKETQLLHFFIQNKGHPLSKDHLLKGIWAYHPETETHTLETHIYRLRQKLEDDPANPQILINCKNGYTLV